VALYALLIMPNSQRYPKNISLVNVEDCHFSWFKISALIIPICFPAVEMRSSPLIREHFWNCWKLSVFKLQTLKSMINQGFIGHLVNRALPSLHEGTLKITLTVLFRDTTYKTNLFFLSIKNFVFLILNFF